MLIDALTGVIDAAAVISNDSDLAFPVSHVRELIPVGLINPTKGYRAGKLAGHPADGAGNYWWYEMRPEDWYRNQLPPTVGVKITKPPKW